MKTILLTTLIFFNLLLTKAQSGLIAHYPMNGNGNDVSGNGYNATINGGPAIATDQFNNPNGALSFDGINDNLSLPIAPFILNNYTYSVCVKPTFLPSNNEIYTMLSFGTDMADQYIVLSNLSNQNLYGFHCGSYFASLVTPDRITTGVLPSTSLTYHVVATRSDSTFCLFVDGTLIDSIPVSNQIPSYGIGTIDAFIGRRAGSAGQYFKGIIEDIQIYDRALNALEISELCAREVGISEFADNVYLNLFPNPTAGNIQITVNKNFINALNIYDAAGKKVLENLFSGYVQETDINVNHLSEGLYFVEAILDDRHVLHSKFLKAD